MTAFTEAREFENILLKALGLYGRDVTRLTVTVAAGEPPRVQFSEIVSRDPLDEVTRAFEVTSLNLKEAVPSG